ncbi:MAG: hypothetical protein ACPLRY_02390 [Candidatus Bathyarchaeales archaeon]
MAMKQRLDIHDFDERLHDTELIRKFEQYCFSEGLGAKPGLSSIYSLSRSSLNGLRRTLTKRTRLMWNVS